MRCVFVYNKANLSSVVKGLLFHSLIVLQLDLAHIFINMYIDNMLSQPQSRHDVQYMMEYGVVDTIHDVLLLMISGNSLAGLQ